MTIPEWINDRWRRATGRQVLAPDQQYWTHLSTSKKVGNILKSGIVTSAGQIRSCERGQLASILAPRCGTPGINPAIVYYDSLRNPDNTLDDFCWMLDAMVYGGASCLVAVTFVLNGSARPKRMSLGRADIQTVIDLIYGNVNMRYALSKGVKMDSQAFQFGPRTIAFCFWCNLEPPPPILAKPQTQGPACIVKPERTD